MCILLIAIDFVPGWPRVLLGNRDEFHARSSAPAQPWRDAPDCVGGRDLAAGGSWLMQRNDGRFAAVTNLRAGLPAAAPCSRGSLVRDFVIGSGSIEETAQRVLADIDSYGPFNLVLGDASAILVIDGSRAQSHRLGAGVHMLGNGPYGVRWARNERLRERFQRAIAEGMRDEDFLFGLLADTAQPDDADLPDTGMGLERERLLAPVFINGEHYGTRASSLVMHDDEGRLLLRERRFGPGGGVLGEDVWECADGEAEWRPG